MQNQNEKKKHKKKHAVHKRSKGGSQIMPKGLLNNVFLGFFVDPHGVKKGKLVYSLMADLGDSG